MCVYIYIMNNRRFVELEVCARFHFVFVEKEVINLSRILKLNEGQIISGFMTLCMRKKDARKIHTTETFS